MRYHRDDIVQRALDVLDDYGLSDLSMRRLGQELGVQPSALYHHFANKQSLLAALADEILRRGVGARPEASGRWDARVEATCTALRDAMLAYRDGAELVSTVVAFGLGAHQPYDDLQAALRDAGLDEELSAIAARTLLHFVLGHVAEEQTQLQAAAVGAIDAEVRETSDFAIGLGLVIEGIRQRIAAPASQPR